MKPKVFIGSSLEGRRVADAIDARLQYTAEPKVWTAGVFGLSEATTASLMHEVSESDFGIFVFSADDAANVRGQLLSVPRDNVVYELGLFSGALGTERCFFLTPIGTDIHLPSDLLGMTSGQYDPNRRDGSLEAAVNPTCSKIELKFRELGFHHGSSHSGLRELAVKFECSEWILDLDSRVRMKGQILDEIGTFCRARPINKKLLARETRSGFAVVLAVAIITRPEAGDDELLLGIPTDQVGRGTTQNQMLRAMYGLKKAGILTQGQKVELAKWARRFKNPVTTVAGEVEEFLR